MFVPYKPESIFEVERHNDRCICGNSAIVSNNGYCQSCLEKKEKFINYIVGNLETSDESLDYNLYIKQIDAMRILMLSQTISTLVDNYFIDYEKDNGNNVNKNKRYDKYLYVSCFEEKIRLSNMFLEVIKPEEKTSKTFSKIRIIDFQKKYYEHILLQIKIDTEIRKLILDSFDSFDNLDFVVEKAKVYVKDIDNNKS